MHVFSFILFSKPSFQLFESQDMPLRILVLYILTNIHQQHCFEITDKAICACFPKIMLQSFQNNWHKYLAAYFSSQSVSQSIMIYSFGWDHNAYFLLCFYSHNYHSNCFHDRIIKSKCALCKASEHNLIRPESVRRKWRPILSTKMQRL